MEERELKLELRRLRQMISILMGEASLGFEGGPWTIAVEDMAIRKYLAKSVQQLKQDCPAPNTHDISYMGAYLENAIRELNTLRESITHSHPSISTLVGSIADKVLVPFKDRIFNAGPNTERVAEEERARLLTWIEAMPPDTLNVRDSVL
jgi:hypothetical protein